MVDIFSRIRTDKTFKTDDIEDISVISESGHSLLQESILRRQEFAIPLIERGVPLDHQDNNGQTALHYALSRSLNEIAERILIGGANPNIRDKYGNNCLWTAVLRPIIDYDIVSRLVNCGADSKKKNQAGRSVSDMVEIKDDDILRKIIP